MERPPAALSEGPAPGKFLPGQVLASQFLRGSPRVGSADDRAGAASGPAGVLDGRAEAGPEVRPGRARLLRADGGVLEAGAAEQPGLHHIGRQRLREVVTLDQVAAGFGQQGAGDVVFGTLRHDGEAEVVCHLDGGLHDHAVAVLVGQVGDEGAVDLQLLRGQRMDVGQRRVAGAVVIDRNEDAELRQLLEDTCRLDGVLHRLGLGHLERRARSAGGRSPPIGSSPSRRAVRPAARGRRR